MEKPTQSREDEKAFQRKERMEMLRRGHKNVRMLSCHRKEGREKMLENRNLGAELSGPHPVGEGTCGSSCAFVYSLHSYSATDNHLALCQGLGTY